MALHINARFSGNASTVVRNSLLGQQWGMEENSGHFPFMPGQPFEILILVDQDAYQVAIMSKAPLLRELVTPVAVVCY